MKALPLFACALLALPAASCRRSFSTGGSFHPPEARPAAKDAAEWIARADESWAPDLDDLFAELPPQAEWAKVIDYLKTPNAKLHDEEDKLAANLFGQSLDVASDPKEIETSLRSLILARKNRMERSYSRNKALKYLFTFSPSAEEANAWVAANLPPLAAGENDGSGHHRELTKAEQLLAENKIDEGIDALWEQSRDKESYSRFSALGKLLEIGGLLGKPEVATKAREAFISAVLSISKDETHSIHHIRPLITDLSTRKDWKTLRKIAETCRDKDRSDGAEFHAVALVAIHHLEGSDKFMQELANSSRYGVEDENAYRALLLDPIYGLPISVGDLTVRSLHAKGEKDKASALLKHLLAANSGTDRLYRLSLELFPDTSAEFFKSLLIFDPFEERPLIWLAEQQLAAGNLDEARKLVDQAIALDPSDGEQGKDSRMQVYGVLSRILAAQGDNEKAKFFDGVMKAIRSGEEADDYLAVGLVDEAVRRYRESLGHFQDAYCLQSRLAMTLMRAGKFEEAKVHFEKAFELMPVSFGPVESHCFGCEGIFEEKRVQDIALNVFRKFISKTPDNPRSHYLLGLLLEKTGDNQQAALSYRRALEIDPKYYNCAKHLHQLLNSRPETIREAAAFFPTLIAISPYPELAEHFHTRTDLRQAWIDAQTPPPSPLALPALPQLFKPEKQKADPDDVHISSNYVSRKDATDGWSTEELLRGNDYVDWIDNGY